LSGSRMGQQLRRFRLGAWAARVCMQFYIAACWRRLGVSWNVSRFPLAAGGEELATEWKLPAILII
jgi:hypothetical protein